MTWKPWLRRRFFPSYLAFVAIVLLLASAGFAQNSSQASAPVPQFSPDDWKKFSGVFSEFGRIIQKAQESVQCPPPRTQSRLLPLLPKATIAYAAFPNYGEASHQFLAIFNEELKTNADLRAWWERGDMATQGPKFEEALEKFYQLSLYLGDEVVVSATNRGNQSPAVLVLAEVRKPGLKQFLQQMLRETADKGKPAARIIDLAELAAANDAPLAKEPVILVLPDLVVGAPDVATLRSFNAQRERNSQDFLSTGFGQRLAESYEGGTSITAGVDLQTILHQMPPSTERTEEMFERTGFSDMKYLIWERKNLFGTPASQMELSFTGPRRSIASWLAAPGPMRSLEFVSPKTLMAFSLLLKNPATIFDDIQDLATASNPNALASLRQTERAMNMNFRQDIFSHLDGEITIEMDRLAPDPAWKVLLKTNDASGLLASLRTLFSAARISPVETDEDGVTYHTIQIPNPQKAQEISYAAVDGYLIVASSRGAIAESVHARRSGESLAASHNFQAALPPGNLSQPSALFFEDPLAFAALTLRRVSPELADSLKPGADSKPAIISVYADTTALREVSRRQTVDLGATMIIAAIAIPNLLRARMAANEASAVATVRTANTAQITYAVSYPQKGYAPSLAALGPDSVRATMFSSQHAGLIDFTLGNPSCTAGEWCIKSGYRFTIRTTCTPQQRCREYTVVATPVNTSTGTRSFCSTSDAVIRVQTSPPLTVPINARQCQSWTPLH